MDAGGRVHQPPQLGPSFGGQKHKMGKKFQQSAKEKKVRGGKSLRCREKGIWIGL